MRLSISCLVSHVWDMRGEAFGTPVALHGLQCAVGTYLSARVHERIKAITPDKEKALAFVERFDYAVWAETLRAFLGRGADAMIALEAKEGKYDKKKHKARLGRILSVWQDILRVIDEEIPTLTEFTALYDAVGLPKSMAEIGLDNDILPLTFAATKDIRDKYVLSRLCFDLGIINDVGGEIKC